MASLLPGRHPVRLWALFAIFIALPAIALALAGFRVLAADKVERTNRLENEAALTAKLVDAALGDGLERAIASALNDKPLPGVTAVIHDRRSTVFPTHRVYVADNGVTPAIESAVPTGTAGTNIPSAIIDTIADASRYPRLPPPTVITVWHTLDQLRAGTWWLSLEQRRAYDHELTRLLNDRTDQAFGPDRQLDWLATVHQILERSDDSRTRAYGVSLPSGAALVVWSRNSPNGAPARGMVADADATQMLVRELVETTAREQGWRADVHPGSGVTEGRPALIESPLASVTGWSVALSPLASAEARPWQAYGLFVLPLVVLAIGLVMMARSTSTRRP